MTTSYWMNESEIDFHYFSLSPDQFKYISISSILGWDQLVDIFKLRF